jgi:hypothetical protein
METFEIPVNHVQVGDLVAIPASLSRTYKRAGEVGIVIKKGTARGSSYMLEVMYETGVQWVHFNNMDIVS